MYDVPIILENLKISTDGISLCGGVQNDTFAPPKISGGSSAPSRNITALRFMETI